MKSERVYFCDGRGWTYSQAEQEYECNCGTERVGADCFENCELNCGCLDED